LLDARAEMPHAPAAASVLLLTQIPEGPLNCSIAIDSVAPVLIQENEPIKITWTLNIGEGFDARNLTVSLLTDDARLILLDATTHDSPPEKAVAVQQGQKISRTVTVVLQRRKGLVDEQSRDGSPSPMFVIARVRNERDEIVAGGVGVEVQVVGLAKRTMPRIFV